MKTLEEYLVEAFDGFLADPASSSFQKGYLSALIEVAKQCTSIDVEPIEARQSAFEGKNEARKAERDRRRMQPSVLLNRIK